MENQNMEKQRRDWTKFFFFLGLLEIAIAIVASTGLGLNVLATTNGTADVRLVSTGETVGEYYTDLTMKIRAYDFVGHFEGSNTTDRRTYTYQNAYQNHCNGQNTSEYCNLRYVVWKWTSAFIALGTIACVIVFVTGVFLLFLACCREPVARCFCGNNEKDRTCCHCLFTCSAELWLLVLNIVVFILFAFSWAIIIGLKYAKNLNKMIESVANESLNNQKEIETYDFTFEKLKVGSSLWPLAVASLLALVVIIYLFIGLTYQLCCSCCCAPRKNKEHDRVEMGSLEPEV